MQVHVPALFPIPLPHSRRPLLGAVSTLRPLVKSARTATAPKILNIRGVPGPGVPATERTANPFQNRRTWERAVALRPVLPQSM
jgi:hypothetical protein